MKKRIIALGLIVLSLFTLCSCTVDKAKLDQAKNKLEYEIGRGTKEVEKKLDKAQDALLDTVPTYEVGNKKELDDVLSEQEKAQLGKGDSWFKTNTKVKD